MSQIWVLSHVTDGNLCGTRRRSWRDKVAVYVELTDDTDDADDADDAVDDTEMMNRG